MKKITERTKAKNSGDYSLADRIREDLLNHGITIKDEKDETIWRK